MCLHKLRLLLGISGAHEQVLLPLPNRNMALLVLLANKASVLLGNGVKSSLLNIPVYIPLLGVL